MTGEAHLIALLCTDGSALSLEALGRARRLIREPDRVVVATVIAEEDPLTVSGTGHHGAVLTPAELEQLCRYRIEEGHRVLDETVAALGLVDAEQVLLHGEAGEELVHLAVDLHASVILAGTRGRGGLRRAVLGSVSDHLVRHAPCPVITANTGTQPGD